MACIKRLYGWKQPLFWLINHAAFKKRISPNAIFLKPKNQTKLVI
ncbi:hypothetical protein M23134_00865 [Microscilla marina ATCC 23134]|uniref:Uncharacterized protein n=1 Tax=Microscilla marina ATCC 23134 TaxID=313606 RepID=A1ZUM5_MICM2|nr:hypothetical protein M23134_00865 [Microscilla marina ATCC 23134]